MEIVRKLIIHIPALPDRLLGQNRSRYAHWGEVLVAKKHLESATFGAALAARQQWERAHSHLWIPLNYASLQIVIEQPKGHRRMDDSRLIECLQAAFDVLQIPTNEPTAKGHRASIIVNDSRLKFLPVIWERVLGRGGIVFEVTGVLR